MYKVYIDTSERYKKSVRLVKYFNNTDSVRDSGAITEIELGSRFGDIDIVVSLKELLDENNLRPVDIEEVIPNLGPGSFTGLKMGVTVANLINWLNGRKSIDELDMPEYGGEPNIQK